MRNIASLDLSVRTANAVASVILGRQAAIPDHKNVAVDDIVVRLSEISESLTKKQKTELVDALRMSASGSYLGE